MNLNRGEWKKMENEWARLAAEGKVVKVKIDVVYESGTRRPAKFIVEHKIDGINQPPQIFLNQPGG